jgi:hypothetical protein
LSKGADQQEADDHAQRGADDALDQPFDQDQPQHRAPGRAHGAQHADVVFTFHHHGAECVEHDEAAHAQCQHAEEGEDEIGHLQGGFPFVTAGADGTGLIAFAQLFQDEGAHGVAVYALLELTGDGVDLPGQVEDLLRRRQRHEEFLIAKDRSRRQHAHDLKLGHAIRRRHAHAIPDLASRLGDEALAHHDRVQFVRFDPTALNRLEGQSLRRRGRVPAVDRQPVEVAPRFGGDSEIRRQKDRTLQHRRDQGDARRLSYDLSFVSAEGVAGLMAEDEIHGVGRERHVLTECRLNRGDHPVHAEDDHHAEDNRQRGQDRPHFTPPQIAERQRPLNVHRTLTFSTARAAPLG